MVRVGVFSDTLRGDRRHSPRRRGRAWPATATREWVASLAQPHLHRDTLPRASAPIVASDQAWKRSGLNARRPPARPIRPSTFIAGLLPSAPDTLRSYCFCGKPLECPGTTASNMPKLSGAEHARTRRQGVLSLWPAGCLPRAGAAQGLACHRFPSAAGRLRSALARPSSRRREPRSCCALGRHAGVRPGSWETRTS